MTILGLDAACDCSKAAPALVKSGYQWVGRYVVRPEDTRIVGKALLKPEAQALSDAGLKIVSIYETNPTSAEYFDYESGLDDGHEAVAVAEALGQPSTVPIYFTVDCDLGPKVVNALVLQYFMGVKEAGWPVGVYGSGLVCDFLAKEHLVTYTWLAQSEGWSGYAAFKDRATIVQESSATRFISVNAPLENYINYDNDTAQSPDYGSWSLPPETLV